jgi:hypothetical protein
MYVGLFTIVILYSNLVASGTAGEKTDMEMKENKYMQMVLMFDIVILTVFIYIYMIGLARVNKLALDTVAILENNSTLYKHLILYKDYYFPGLDKSDDPYRQEVSIGHDKIFKKETSVHIYYLFSHIVEEQFAGRDRNLIPAHLEYLYEVNQSNIDHFNAKQVEGAEKILGWVIDGAALSAIFAFTISMCLVFVEIMYLQ